MPAPDLLTQFYVKVNGALDPEFMSDLLSVEVDDSLHMPGMFEIEVADEGLQWTDRFADRMGSEVEVQTVALPDVGGQETPVTVFNGEITAIETHFPEDKSPRLVIRGYDRSHRLHAERKVQTFLQMTDSDIMRKVAQASGLETDVVSTSEVHKYVVQNNQTTYEFLQERARRVGHVLRVEGRKLISKPANAMNQKGPTLEWGTNLFSFYPRMSVAAQPSAVIVRGWDRSKKQTIESRAGRPPMNSQIGIARRAGAGHTKAFSSSPELAVVTTPVRSQREAQMLAEAVLHDTAQADLYAQGICAGDGTIRAGRLIDIKNVGTRFNGTYFVTRARHRYTRDEGYRTHFDASSRGADTVVQLVSEGVNNAETVGGTRDRINGVVVGIVTNINDEEQMARVKVKLPWLSDDIESMWAPIAVPMAGKNRGFQFMPEVNDEVLVAFEHGDPNYPYVIGFLWNGEDKPPIPTGQLSSGDGKVARRSIKSSAGHTVTFVEEAGKEKIEIIDKTGSNKIIIDSTTREILVEAGTKVTVKAQEAMVEAATQATVKSTNVNVEASARLTLKGGAGVQIDGGPMVTVKGGIIQLN